MTRLKLISHPLCPYVQRAAIILFEKAIPHDRVDIDLADKPDWFLAMSPLGKTPVLQAGDTTIFESAVIAEYLDETTTPRLLPDDPLRRAEHRSWMEFASAMLSGIGGLYSAPDARSFAQKADALCRQFNSLEARLDRSEWFDGDRFGLVDASFAPMFRYFDVIDTLVDVDFFDDRPRTSNWRGRLARRPSVIAAVPGDYNGRLLSFLKQRNSQLGSLARQAA